MVNGKGSVIDDGTGKAYPRILVPSSPLKKISISHEEEEEEHKVEGAGAGFGNPSVVHDLTLRNLV
jgi:glucokinase